MNPKKSVTFNLTLEQQQQQSIKDKLQIQNDILYYLDYTVEEQDTHFNNTYSLVCEIPEKNFIHDFIFNKESSIMIAKYKNCVKICQLHPQTLKVFQEIQLKCHAMLFLQQQNEFILINEKGSIMFWTQDENQSWYCRQTLQNDQQFVNTIIVNNDENHIICGSQYGGQIRIWIKFNNKWILNQTLQSQSLVTSLSLNESEKLLASFGHNGQVIIYKQDLLKVMKRLQRIKVGSYCGCLKFIRLDMLAISSASENLFIFKKHPKSKLFTMIIQCSIRQPPQSYFKPNFIQFKEDILIVQHQASLYFIKVNDINEATITQIIDLKTENAQVAVTHNLKQIITWSKADYEIGCLRIRKYI